MTMTRSEALYRAYAEKSDAKNGKKRWRKSIKPTQVGYNDGTGLYCEKSQKFPYFARCPSCEKVFLDTQLASLAHLSKCDAKGFLTFHSVKALDEEVVSKIDRQIFNWRQEAEKSAEDFLPEVTCTVDGYGSSNVHKRTRAKLSDIMKSAEAVDNTNVREKSFTVRDEKKVIVGKLRVVHGAGQEDVKTELTQRIVNMPLYWNVARKRKVTVDFEENLNFKCKRRTSPEELFSEPLIEHYEEALEK